jgi:hypothetical protein
MGGMALNVYITVGYGQNPNLLNMGLPAVLLLISVNKTPAHRTAVQTKIFSSCDHDFNAWPSKPAFPCICRSSGSQLAERLA